jgi:hypothetical protein
MMPFICSSPVQAASRDRLKQQPVVMKPRKAPSGPPRQTLAKSMRTRDEEEYEQMTKLKKCEKKLQSLELLLAAERKFFEYRITEPKNPKNRSGWQGMLEIGLAVRILGGVLPEPAAFLALSAVSNLWRADVRDKGLCRTWLFVSPEHVAVCFARARSCGLRPSSVKTNSHVRRRRYIPRGDHCSHRGETARNHHP